MRSKEGERRGGSWLARRPESTASFKLHDHSMVNTDNMHIKIGEEEKGYETDDAPVTRGVQRTQPSQSPSSRKRTGIALGRECEGKDVDKHRPE